MANRKVENGSALNLSDIGTSNESRYKTVEIPEIEKDGKPGTLTLKIPSAGVVLGFSDKDEADKKEYLLRLMVDVVVSPDGSPMFADIEQVKSVSVDVFTRLSGIVTDMINEATSSLGNTKGKESTVGEGSPTN